VIVIPTTITRPWAHMITSKDNGAGSGTTHEVCEGRAGDQGVTRMAPRRPNRTKVSEKPGESQPSITG
jgi:hypothetical protein